MTLPSIDAIETKRLIDEGAVLDDVHEPDEHARKRVRLPWNRGPSSTGGHSATIA